MPGIFHANVLQYNIINERVDKEDTTDINDYNPSTGDNCPHGTNIDGVDVRSKTYCWGQRSAKGQAAGTDVSTGISCWDRC